MERAVESEDTSGAGHRLWHLCWRAVAGHELFVHPTLYAHVRGRLIDAHRRPGRVLLTYLLVPNEIHALCKLAPDDSAGRVARAIGNIVARWVRDAQAERGPVFDGPFRAHPIESTDALRSEVLMLAWRPVFQGLCRTPSHHGHAGIRVALGLTPAQGFDARPLLGLFGNSVQSARAALRAWLAKRPSAREARQWELARGLALATGTIGPRRIMARQLRGAGAAALVAASGAGGIDGALELLEAWVLVKLGVRGSCDLRTMPGAAGAQARALVACLAVEHELCSASSVARHYGRAKATLSEQMAVCRTRTDRQQILRTPVHRIIEEAVALPPNAG